MGSNSVKNSVVIWPSSRSTHRPEPRDELDRVPAGRDDVAEVHHDPDVVGQAIGQQLGALEVPAQPMQMQ